jgi:hypothetical protein
MPDTFQAAIVVAVALVPGALYFWAFERQAGRWGVALSDRLLRFVGLSALFHAAIAPVSYWFWANEWPKLSEGEPVSLWLWGVAIGYVAVPLASGTAIGFATRLGLPWSRWFAGPHPAPRAWDYLFGHELDGYVRMHLKSGRWIAGVFAEINDLAPYTAGYPEDEDLFLPATVAVDPETGELPKDENGRVVLQPGGLLIRWNEIEYLQFVDESENEDNGQLRRTASSPAAPGLHRRLHVFGQGRLGAQASRGSGSGTGGEATRARVVRREEVAGKRGRRRKQFVGGYTSSGRSITELRPPPDLGPGPGGPRTSGG